MSDRAVIHLYWFGLLAFTVTGMLVLVSKFNQPLTAGTVLAVIGWGLAFVGSFYTWAAKTR